MARVVVSATFVKEFRELPSKDKRRVRAGLAALEADPLTPRSGADIKPLQATEPLKHRLRVGEYRVVFTFDGKTVKVLDLFRRGRGYRE